MSLKESINGSSKEIGEKACLEELESPHILEELKSILLKLNKEIPSRTLFKEKYEVFMLNDLFKWQKPFGDLLKQTIVICGAKPKEISETEYNHNEVFSEETAGSPLALLFDPLLPLNSAENVFSSNKHVVDDFFCPLSENIGRKLLSLCDDSETESLKKLPVLVVCCARNSKALTFFGSWRENKNARFCIKNEGAITKQEQIPKLLVLKGIHLRGFPASFSDVETSVYARYDFLEYECEQNSALKPVKDVNLFVECSWSNSSSILEPLTDECQCFVKLKTVSGDFNSGASSFFKEFKLVEALYQSLENGVMAWPTPEGSRNICQEVEEFIRNEKNIPIHNKLFYFYERKDSDLTAILEQALIKGRTDLDFTEKLWNILKNCSSTVELTKAFSILYHELDPFFTCSFVHSKNTSTISVEIKTMLHKGVAIPNLDYQLALRLLLEIAIEKLRRDYESLFASFEMIPHECLSYYRQPDLHSLEAITCLKKLHSVVELMIVCAKVLNLPKPLISSFVRNCLNHYTAVSDIDLQHVFTLHLPTITARQLLDPMRPTIWELSFLSSFKGFMKQSIHHYQTTPMLDHIYAPKNTNPNSMLSTASYTYMTSVLVQDDFCSINNEERVENPFLCDKSNMHAF